MTQTDKTNIPSTKVTLPFLFWSFLKIGATSFGGFMALISVVQKELVEKKQLIKDQTILDATSLASILPGPMAVNVIVYIGYSLKGIKGAIVSMLGILLPSFLFMLLLSIIYIEYGQFPLLANFFKGVLPAVIAIIISVAINMAKKHIKDYKQVLICIASISALFFIKSVFNTIIIIIGGGFLGYVIYKNYVKPELNPQKKPFKIKKQLVNTLLIATSIGIIVTIIPYLLTGESYKNAFIQKQLMLTFSSISVTLFGGGYVIIPAMQEIIVSQLQWVTKTEFIEAIAMGQITPGPIFISATFIGYKLGGLLGAITATLSIFIPPGLIMIFFSEFLNKIKNSSVVKATFKGIRPAVIGMIFSAAFTIGKSISINWFAGFIFLAVLLASIKYKIDVVYLIPLSGIAGILFFNFY
ncbi:chromate efflux transporter [Flavivirga jejuensis]|uniref:Chromate efflux transporter n=1 Tax=Flavivirga jejuensis TaxID=870487 RepID=A0ABT8WUX7_9FLAO|nr:chromate efflux transporter [Flavivirga jejuensis]MDO5976985.1 chromate efflux transporter [Flavivirga jejuensis]